MDSLIKPSIINFLQKVSKKPSANFVFETVSKTV
jgi:hypothetical protein